MCADVHSTTVNVEIQYCCVFDRSESISRIMLYQIMIFLTGWQHHDSIRMYMVMVLKIKIKIEKIAPTTTISWQLSSPVVLSVEVLQMNLFQDHNQMNYILLFFFGLF